MTCARTRYTCSISSAVITSAGQILVEGKHFGQSVQRPTVGVLGRLQEGERPDDHRTRRDPEFDGFGQFAEQLLRMQREPCLAVDLGHEVVPELMPITSLRTVARAEELCGRGLPEPVLARLRRAAGTGSQPDRAAVRAEGIAIATEMAQRLIVEGAPCLHFITLNFAKATSEVLTDLGYGVGAAPLPAR